MAISLTNGLVQSVRRRILELRRIVANEIWIESSVGCSQVELVHSPVQEWRWCKRPNFIDVAVYAGNVGWHHELHIETCLSKCSIALLSPEIVTFWSIIFESCLVVFRNEQLLRQHLCFVLTDTQTSGLLNVLVVSRTSTNNLLLFGLCLIVNVVVIVDIRTIKRFWLVVQFGVLAACNLIWLVRINLIGNQLTFMVELFFKIDWFVTKFPRRVYLHHC